MKNNLSKEEELNILIDVQKALLSVPDNYRSMNHTALLREYEYRILCLKEELHIDYDGD